MGLGGGEGFAAVTMRLQGGKLRQCRVEFAGFVGLLEREALDLAAGGLGDAFDRYDAGNLGAAVFGQEGRCRGGQGGE